MLKPEAPRPAPEKSAPVESSQKIGSTLTRSDSVQELALPAEEDEAEWATAGASRQSKKPNSRPQKEQSPVKAPGNNLFDLLDESNMDENVEPEQMGQQGVAADVMSSHLGELADLVIEPNTEEPIGDLLLEETMETRSNGQMNIHNGLSHNLSSLWQLGNPAERQRTLLDSELPHNIPDIVATAPPVRRTQSKSPNTEASRSREDLGDSTVVKTTTTNGRDWEVKAVNGNGDVLSPLHDTIAEMLELAQSHRGRLEFKLDIGRIFMSNLPVAAIKNFDPSLWHDVMRPNDGLTGLPTSGFTNM
jgi:hypothetical protein